jgi:DNA replication protein DnaC
MTRDPQPANDQPTTPAAADPIPVRRPNSLFGTPESLASLAEQWRARQGRSQLTTPRQVNCTQCGDRGIAGYTPEQGNVYCTCAVGQAERDQARRRYEGQEAEDAAWRRKVLDERLAAFSTRTLPGGVIPTLDTLPPSPPLARVSAFAEEWNGEQGILLSGGVGTGKTTLLTALVRTLQERLIKQKRAVRLVTVPDFLRELRAGFEPQRQALGESYSRMMDQYRMCGVLVFDDLGAEKLTEWVGEQVYMLVDHRYRQRLPIFASSNFGKEELAQRLDRRVLDRLRETCTMIEVVGPNLRDQAVQRKSIGKSEER